MVNVNILWNNLKSNFLDFHSDFDTTFNIVNIAHNVIFNFIEKAYSSYNWVVIMFRFYDNKLYFIYHIHSWTLSMYLFIYLWFSQLPIQMLFLKHNGWKR